MKVVVGLGNPGDEYKDTRHNTGKIVLGWLGGLAAVKGVRLVELDSFMNDSGPAFKEYLSARKLKLRPDDLLIIHDDLDIKLGRAKMTFGRSGGGHKGVESVIRVLKSRDFWRLRIGIQPKRRPDPKKVKDFLLSNFTPAEQKIIAKEIKKLVEAVEMWVEKPEKAMGFINQRK